MEESKKTKRVQWPSDANLCKVKLISTKDYPKLFMRSQDCLQEKPPGILRVKNDQLSDNVPPGFECSFSVNALSRIRWIAWKRPPKFIINSNWHVAAGEESQEVQAQKVREMGVIEAIYHHDSDIPKSCLVSLDVETEHSNDRLTPTIPLVGIEEAAVAADIPFDLSALNKNTCAPDRSSGVKEALALFADAGIDPNLPGKSFSNLKMVEILMNNNGGLNNAAGAEMLTPVPYTNLPAMVEPMVQSMSKQVHHNGNLHNPPNKLQPTNNSISTTSPRSAMVELNGNLPYLTSKVQSISKPVFSEGSFLHLPSEIQQTGLRNPGPSGTCPPSGLQVQAASSISLPMTDSVLVSTPRLVPLPLPNTIPDLAQTLLKTLMDMTPEQRKSVPPKLGILLAGLNMVPNDFPPSKNNAPQTYMAPTGNNTVKDVNYIRNLIREHGTDKQEQQDKTMSQNGTYYNQIKNPEIGKNIRLIEVRPKHQVPCKFFKSTQGCRNGNNCPFQHVETDSKSEDQSVKERNWGTFPKRRKLGK